MRKHTVFDSLNSLETLDLRLSPTSLSLGASLVPPAVGHLVSTADDSPAGSRAVPLGPMPRSVPRSSRRRGRLDRARLDLRAHARRLACA